MHPVQYFFLENALRRVFLHPVQYQCIIDNASSSASKWGKKCKWFAWAYESWTIWEASICREIKPNELAQSSSSSDNAKIIVEDKRVGTGSSHWCRSSCWSRGRWCPATAAPVHSSQTQPTAASCCHLPRPATRTTPRRTAGAARPGAARRGRGARAGGGNASSRRAGAAASPSTPRRRCLPNAIFGVRCLDRSGNPVYILLLIHQLLQVSNLKWWGRSSLENMPYMSSEVTDSITLLIAI